MSCSSCGSSGSCGCGPEAFAVNTAGIGISGNPQPRLSTPLDLCGTLGQRLIPTVDRIRNLYTKFGLRPYNVSIIRTRWTGGRRGVGTEQVIFCAPITPTPLLSDMTSVTSVASPIGASEQGDVTLTQISGAYTEDQLYGLDQTSTPIPLDEQVYWEIEFPPACKGGQGERRRFTPSSAPMFTADKFEWEIQLTRQRVDRIRNGLPGGV